MPDTVDLASLETGRGDPIVVLHGLFGSARNWNTIARRLDATHHVHALDLRNHGSSPWAEEMDYPAMAADVAAYIERRDLAPCAVLGHSMGGKAAMWLALTRPELVGRLIVADIAPVRSGLSLHQYVRAMRDIDLSRFGRRAEVDSKLAPAIPDAGVRSFLLQNLVAENGNLRWRINLEVLDRRFGDIADWPEPPAGAVYRGPTLFLAGSRSDYVKPEHEPAIRRLFPEARIVRIEGAGHWLHAEKPDEVFAELSAFLTGG